MSARLSIEVVAGTHRPGDRVTGAVTVTDGGRVRTLTASLVYREWTRDYSEPARVEGATTLASDPVADGARLQFGLSLPADALPNHISARGGLRWEVVAETDVPGPDAAARQPIEVEAAGPG